MRTDWVFETISFFPRSSISGSIGALDQYLIPPGFSIEATKSVGINTRTTNIFIGLDTSGLYVGQDVEYIPGIIYPNTKILSINPGVDIVSTQSTLVGPNTTRISGINTTGITTDLKVLVNPNVIAPNTVIVGILSSAVQIFPASLNSSGVTTQINFYQNNSDFNIDISARTTNNFVETVNLGFGTGTVVGVGSTFFFNVDARFPSGALKFVVGDDLVPLTGILTGGYNVVGFDTYISGISTNFILKTEINPYRYLGAASTSVNVGLITALIAPGDFVRGQYFPNSTVSSSTISSISGQTVYFSPESLNTFAVETSVAFTRLSSSISPSATTIGINTVGINTQDSVVGTFVAPNTVVTLVGENYIQINNPTINTITTQAELLFGYYQDTISYKNRVYLNKSGINTSLVGVTTFTVGYYGPETKVTTAEDYGDLINAVLSEKITIGPNASNISVDTSGLSINQYLKPVTGVFDREGGTYITSVGSGNITINVGSSNTVPQTILLEIGDLTFKESKRYLYNPFNSYTFGFLTIFGSGIVVSNDSAFPDYANPPGSANNDPSLRYKYSPFIPISWDINKVLGVKDLPQDKTGSERAAARGRRTYIGFYPHHIFGR